MAQKTGAKVIIQTPTPEWEKELNKSLIMKNFQSELFIFLELTLN